MKIAVYGTLRKAGRLYDDYLHGLEPLSTEVQNGWDMYSLGSYPYITSGKGQITVEVYEMPLHRAVVLINMEMGAGYAMGSVATEVGDAVIFHMDRWTHTQIQERSKYPLVDSGDWINYKAMLLQGVTNGIR